MVADAASAAALFLLINIALGLVRILRGPTTADRLLSVQLFGTTGTAILVLLSLRDDAPAYLNIALIFALLAGVLGVVFTRYWQAGDIAAIPGESNRELE